MPRLVEHLPLPVPGRLNVYVFGPSPGESIAIVTPENEWIVVDSCHQQGTNLALALLNRCNVKQIALAVLTHPDADHYRGFADIVESVECSRIWTFPLMIDRKSLIARLGRQDRLGADDLARALRTIDSKMSRNKAEPVWAPRSVKIGGAQVTCVAPCPADVSFEQRALGKLMAKAARGQRFSADETSFLLGTNVVTHANGISLALTLEWSGCKICLGGDLEAPDDGSRGWNGALAVLDFEGLSTLVEDVALIKLSHHGSKGAFSRAAFGRHARNSRPSAVITPFPSGSNPPPHPEVLRQLREVAREIGITAEPHVGWDAVETCGWTLSPKNRSGAEANCVVATCDASGNVEFTACGDARTFS